MSGAPAWLVTAAGLALVAVMLVDLFHTLFHPSGQGRVSWAVMRLAWRLSRTGRRRSAGVLAGPLAMLAAITTWAGLLVTGWALVYWAHLPGGFAFGSSLQPAQRSDLLDAFYVSLVTAATLGYGDVLPTAGWLRVLAPLEAVLGFALLTAAVTWVLQVYPALTRRRALALRVATLRRSAPARSVREVDSTAVASLLEDLAGDLATVRLDLTQYSETYFFRDVSADLALPVALAHVTDLCDEGQASARADVRLAAAHLACALDDLAGLLDRQFLRVGGGVGPVLTAFADDHGHTLDRVDREATR